MIKMNDNEWIEEMKKWVDKINEMNGKKYINEILQRWWNKYDQYEKKYWISSFISTLFAHFSNFEEIGHLIYGDSVGFIQLFKVTAQFFSSCQSCLPTHKNYKKLHNVFKKNFFQEQFADFQFTNFQFLIFFLTVFLIFYYVLRWRREPHLCLPVVLDDERNHHYLITYISSSSMNNIHTSVYHTSRLLKHSPGGGALCGKLTWCVTLMNYLSMLRCGVQWKPQVFFFRRKKML